MSNRMNVMKLSGLASGVLMALALTSSANASSLFSQGFETDTSGWFGTGSPYGTTTRVVSGTNGITAYQGSYFAYVYDSTPSGANATDTTGPYTNFGGYSSVFPGTYTASIAIYLDPHWLGGSGFEYSVASNGSDGAHQRDYVFHVSNASDGHLRVGVSNNSSDGAVASLSSSDYEVTTAGWYIFQHTFYDDGGTLAVAMSLYDSTMAELFSQTLSDPADTIPGEVGGNRYGWFTLIDAGPGDGLAIDSVSMVPLPAALPLFLSGGGLLGLLGFRRKNRRAAVAAA